MRYTEQEIEIMDEYESLKANHLSIEERLQRRGLWLDQRNALEHMLDLAASELEDARSEYYSTVLSGHP